MPTPKLFSPGPVDVSPQTYAAMAQTMIGHRGSEFEALYASLQPGLQQMFGTGRPVFDVLTGLAFLLGLAIAARAAIGARSARSAVTRTPPCSTTWSRPRTRPAPLKA